MNAARRGRLLLLAGAVGGLALAGSATLVPVARPRGPGAGEAASVNGVAIARADLERALARVEADKQDPISDAERRHVLERLIDDELLVQRGVALGLIESDPAVRKALASAVIASVVSEASGAPADEAELERFFAENRAYFARSPRVQVLRISVRDGEGADARVAGALASLGAGVPPREVAARFADPGVVALPDVALPEAKLRELLGPTLAETAIALEPGAHSPALASDGGRSILVSLSRVPGAQPELDEVREEVAAAFARRAGERALAAYLAERRREAEIALAPDAPR